MMAGMLLFFLGVVPFPSPSWVVLVQNPYCEEDMRRNKECSVGISNVHAVKVHVENGKVALKRSVD